MRTTVKKATPPVDASNATAGGRRLALRLDAALPQTQCTRCGYPDCAAYAHAIAFDGVAINRCPPGGAQGIARLARISGRPVIALNPDNGIEAPRQLALIDEAWCIGCTLCRDACPTDAILGLTKHMHTVIEPRCTGCELCVPVCPVDCILLENASGERTGWDAWSPEQADAAREHHRQRKRRLAHGSTAQAGHHTDDDGAVPRDEPGVPPSAGNDETALAQQAKRQMVEAALARARERARPAADRAR